MSEHMRILVTGGAKRVGRALSERLAAAGWTVAVHYNKSAEAADRLVREIEDKGGAAATVQADLSDEEAAAALIENGARALGGPLTALVNNASLFEPDEWNTVSKESWNRHMAVNLRAPFLIAQSLARHLPADREGRIVNILDQRVWRLTPLYMSYTLSKAGLWTLTRTLAQALAPRIRVNAVGPGPVLPSVHQNEAQFKAQRAALPLGDGPDPGEIAEAVLYLLSAGAVTGQMIAVDGGQHLSWRTPDVVGVD